MTQVQTFSALLDVLQKKEYSQIIQSENPLLFEAILKKMMDAAQRDSLEIEVALVDTLALVTEGRFKLGHEVDIVPFLQLVKKPEYLLF